MNHSCIKQSKLIETMSKDESFDISVLPSKYQNIKTEQVTKFVIKNNQDLFDCLDFLRYMMIEEIPKEVFDYIKDQDYDEMDKIINTQFQDFHNKELNDYVVTNSKEFKKLFDRGDYVGESTYGLVIENIHQLVFKGIMYEDEDESYRIYNETTKIVRKKYPELFDEDGAVIEEKYDKYDEMHDLEWNILRENESEKTDLGRVYDDVHIIYKNDGKIIDSKKDMLPVNFMDSNSQYRTYKRPDELIQFTLIKINLV